MSVLVEFAMFPTDKGESVSPYVSKIIDMIDCSGITYQLTPMGTIFECESLEEATTFINKAYAQLEPDCERVYSSIKLDIRKNKSNRLQQKIDSVEKQLGRKVKI